jgi:hypothetical protein
MRTGTWLIILLIAGGLTVTGLLVFKSGEIPSSPPLPSPNGYDDFVKAGRMLSGRLYDYGGWNEEKLRRVTIETQSREQKFNVVLIDLAARAYELEKGHRPKSFADLVPSYLKAIPKEPSSATNPIFKL